MAPHNNVLPRNRPPAAGTLLNLFDDDDVDGETENAEPVERDMPEAFLEQPPNSDAAGYRPATKYQTRNR